MHTQLPTHNYTNQSNYEIPKTSNVLSVKIKLISPKFHHILEHITIFMTMKRFINNIKNPKSLQNTSPQGFHTAVKSINIRLLVYTALSYVSLKSSIESRFYFTNRIDAYSFFICMNTMHYTVNLLTEYVMEL